MAQPPTMYHERLTAPWWAWPVTLGAAALLAAQLTMGAIQLRHPLTYAIACCLAAAGLLALSRIRIELAPGERAATAELRVDDARLPLAVISSVEPIDVAGRRDLLGADADPLAFVVQRPWLPGGVRIDLDDPGDPTPYWYVSSRRPEQLAAAILTARDSASGRAGTPPS